MQLRSPKLKTQMRSMTMKIKTISAVVIMAGLMLGSAASVASEYERGYSERNEYGDSYQQRERCGDSDDRYRKNGSDDNYRSNDCADYDDDRGYERREYRDGDRSQGDDSSGYMNNEQRRADDMR